MSETNNVGMEKRQRYAIGGKKRTSILKKMKLPLDKCARWCYNVKYKGNDGKSTLIRWYREQAVGASLSEGKWKTTPEL